jgi:hypothetical protein
MTVVEALAEHLGVLKKPNDRDQVDSKTTRSTAVTAVFQQAVVVNSRAVPVPWKVSKRRRRNGHGTRAMGAVEPWPRAQAAALTIPTMPLRTIRTLYIYLRCSVFFMEAFFTGYYLLCRLRDTPWLVAFRGDLPRQPISRHRQNSHGSRALPESDDIGLWQHERSGGDLKRGARDL